MAVLADIHSNLEALKAVLEDVGQVDQIWCLGDVVGYGPEANECGEMMRERVERCVAGNHDWGVLGKLDLSWFSDSAVEALKITRQIMGEKEKRFLESLPDMEKLGDSILLHGSPRNPIFEYIFETPQAAINFEKFSEKICFFGHTHYPMIFEKEGEKVRKIVPCFQKEIKLKKNCRYLINPGAVGQPRDGDPRASYLLLEEVLGRGKERERKLRFRRVVYPIEKTQKKMKKLGMPEILVERLSLGR